MPTPTTTHALLTRIDEFLALYSLTPSRFGRMAVRDPSLVISLRKGRRISLEMAGKLCAFMDDPPAAVTDARAITQRQDAQKVKPPAPCAALRGAVKS